MTDADRERHRIRILDAGVPDWRDRAQRYDPAPIALRFVVIDDELLVRAQVPDVRDRAPLLQAIRDELGATTPVHFTP